VKNSKSVVTVRRAFKTHFNIGCHGAVPDRKTIMRWVTAFRTTGIITNKKPPGPVPTVTTTLENTEKVRVAVFQSPPTLCAQTSSGFTN